MNMKQSLTAFAALGFAGIAAAAPVGYTAQFGAGIDPSLTYFALVADLDGSGINSFVDNGVVDPFTNGFVLDSNDFLMGEGLIDSVNATAEFDTADAPVGTPVYVFLYEDASPAPGSNVFAFDMRNGLFGPSQGVVPTEFGTFTQLVPVPAAPNASVVIPEPASAGMILAGLGVLAARRRRRA